jgi:hypothetical protein
MTLILPLEFEEKFNSIFLIVYVFEKCSLPHCEDIFGRNVYKSNVVNWS